MKQKIIALSIAATLGLASAAATAAPVVNASGIGIINIIPYFSAQGSNATQISITNTDMVNGKAVKVRFRGAEWSDDIFDFTVFLSPGDVFTGAVTNNGSGVSTFATSDNSCTLPASVNQAFPTDRLHNKATGSLEGYIEIINMADILPNGTKFVFPSTKSYDLFTATKHVSGAAPCKTAGSDAYNLVQGMLQDNFYDEGDSTAIAPAVVGGGAVITGSAVGQNEDWLGVPTTGLTSWARVINTSSVKAFGVPATAITFTAALTRKQYFRQANQSISLAAAVDNLTSDRIFFAKDAGITANFGGAPTPMTAAAGGTPITPMYQFDLPDLSTGIEGTTAVVARDNLTAALSKGVIASEYSTIAEVQAATDIVLTQPTRRYYYNYGSYVSVPGYTPVEGTDYSRSVGSSTALYMIKGDADAANRPYSGLDPKNRVGLADLTGVTLPTGASATPAIFFDREESFANNTGIVISPTPPSTYSLSLKGEASVLSFNRGTGATETGALGAKLTMNDITINGGYTAGWVVMSTYSKPAAGGANRPLPLIGFGATNVAGSQNYGTTLPLRYFGANAALITQ